MKKYGKLSLNYSYYPFLSGLEHCWVAEIDCDMQFPFLSGIVFQIKRVLLEDGNQVYCMWVSRDPEEPGECGRSYANLTLASSFNSTMDQSNFSLGEVIFAYP